MKRKILGICIVALLTLSFVGCNSSDGYYIQEMGREYKYKLELIGPLPNAENEKSLTLTVYSNMEDITFEEVAELLYPSDMDEINPLDIYIEDRKVEDIE